MQLDDRGRMRIARLMALQDLSRRQLAERAGFGSHSFINRLLNGQVSSLSPEGAKAIAEVLDADVHDLFLPRVSTTSGRSSNVRRAS